MKEFDAMDRSYDVFKMFSAQWALATAGDDLEHWNTLTIAWGSVGSIWSRADGPRSIVTIYVSPARHTFSFLQEHDVFTVSFFPEAYRKDLSYLGSHSGRDGDKVAQTSLVPFSTEPGVAFQQAELVFVCRKLYSDPFEGNRCPADIQERLYSKIPPHHYFIGEIIKALSA